MIKNFDPELERTMVVFTKCDMLPSNFNYDNFKIFLKDTNEIFSPKFGFVCVKANFPSYIQASDQTRIEREYFFNHNQFQIYNINDFFTLDVVAEKIIKWIYDTEEFKKNIVNIYNKLMDRSKFVNSELLKLGSEDFDFTSQSKDLYLQSMINAFCETVEKIFTDKSKIEEYLLFNLKLKRIYLDFLCPYPDFRPSYTFKNKEIIEIIQKTKDITLSDFPSDDLVYILLDKEFENLRNELNDYFDNIYEIVNQLFINIINRYFARFPKALTSIQELIISYLNQEFNKTKKLQIDIIEMNFSYIYIDENSPKYKAIMKNNPLKNGFNNNNQKNQNNNLNAKFPLRENEDISFLKSNKEKDSYYKELAEFAKKIIDLIYEQIIISLREYIPKSTMNFFIKNLKSNMRNYLLKYLSMNPELCQELEEDEEAVQKRKHYIETKKKLERIHKIIDGDTKIKEIIKGDKIKNIDTILLFKGINTKNSSQNLAFKTNKAINPNLFGDPPKMDNNKSEENNTNATQNKSSIFQDFKNYLFGKPHTETSSKIKNPSKNNLFGNPNPSSTKNNLFGDGIPNKGTTKIDNLFGNPNKTQQQQNKNKDLKINFSGNIDPKEAYNFYQKNKQYMPSGQQMSGAKTVNNFMNQNNNNNNASKKKSYGNLFG